MRALRKNYHTNSKVIIFIVLLCGICSLLLSVVSSALSSRQESAQALEESKQLLIAAKILSPKGYFLLTTSPGKYVTAKYDPTTEALVPQDETQGESKREPVKATATEISSVASKRIVPILVDIKGKPYTFEDANIHYGQYLSENKKTGYSSLSYKLLYKILPNFDKNADVASLQPEGYIIPVNGIGLWGPIYGFLAIDKDGNRVLGATWATPAETPGLGAVYSEEAWLAQLTNKTIFLPTAQGKTDYAAAPLGLVVVKGKVEDVFGKNSVKSQIAVDGVSGASLTGVGITLAYKNCLEHYRPFLLDVIQTNQQAAK